MTAPKLIVVDDEPDIAEIVAEVAETVGYEVSMTTCAADFQATYVKIKPDIVIPDVDGTELLAWLASQKDKVRIILMSGYDGKYLESANLLGSARGNNIVATVTKPFNFNDLKEILLKHLEG